MYCYYIEWHVASGKVINCVHTLCQEQVLVQYMANYPRAAFIMHLGVLKHPWKHLVMPCICSYVQYYAHIHKS